MGKLETLWSPGLSEADAEAYDRFVATAAGGHYSQTRAWAKLATASRPFAARYFLARRNGQVIGAGLVLQTHLLPIAQMERGPVCADPADLPEVLAALLSESYRHGVLRLSVMPYWAGDAVPQVHEMLQARGFRDVQRFAGRHARTARLDLAGLDAGEPFAGKALSKVRHEISRAGRAGALTRKGERQDMAAFGALNESLLQADRKKLPGAAWYEAVADFYLGRGDQAAMFVCEYQGRAVSTVFVACHGTLATYVIGVSSAEALPFPKMIQPLARAILWAKEIGMTSFDLGGMPLEGDTDSKRGTIADFKRSFTRSEIDLVREHARWF